MSRFVRWAVLASMLVALPSRAGESAVQWDAPVRCQDLPAGVFVPKPQWEKLDAEVRRLQTAETRLSAENASMRAAGPDVTSLVATASVAVALGLLGGFVLARTLSK